MDCVSESVASLVIDFVSVFGCSVVFEIPAAASQLSVFSMYADALLPSSSESDTTAHGLHPASVRVLCDAMARASSASSATSSSLSVSSSSVAALLARLVPPAGSTTFAVAGPTFAVAGLAPLMAADVPVEVAASESFSSSTSQQPGLVGHGEFDNMKLYSELEEFVSVAHQATPILSALLTDQQAIPAALMRARVIIAPYVACTFSLWFLDWVNESLSLIGLSDNISCRQHFVFLAKKILDLLLLLLLLLLFRLRRLLLSLN